MRAGMVVDDGEPGRSTPLSSNVGCSFGHYGKSTVFFDIEKRDGNIIFWDFEKKDGIRFSFCSPGDCLRIADVIGAALRGEMSSEIKDNGSVISSSPYKEGIWVCNSSGEKAFIDKDTAAEAISIIRAVGRRIGQGRLYS